LINLQTKGRIEAFKKEGDDAELPVDNRVDTNMFDDFDVETFLMTAVQE
jgi:hypothetical protein